MSEQEINDLRRALAKAEEERDSARMYLAHIWTLIQAQLDNAQMDDLARISLTVAAEQARLASMGGKP